ncbi:uncharacterized protein Dsimw501_GD27949 [Drosophila simulans]|nr:uncharacterized protein Dsimw501_GD27949 [Drosophila simulans]
MTFHFAKHKNSFSKFVAICERQQNQKRIFCLVSRSVVLVAFQAFSLKMYPPTGMRIVEEKEEVGRRDECLLTLIFTAFRDGVFAQCQLKRSNSENITLRQPAKLKPQECDFRNRRQEAKQHILVTANSQP